MTLQTSIYSNTPSIPRQFAFTSTTMSPFIAYVVTAPSVTMTLSVMSTNGAVIT